MYFKGAKGEAYFLNTLGVVSLSEYLWSEIKQLPREELVPLYIGDSTTLTF
jgi:hypothetical protein